MNKKASLHVLVFVFLVLTLCISSLYMYVVYKGEITAQVDEHENLESLLLREKEIGLFFDELIEESFYKTYQEFVNEGKYVAEQRKDVGGRFVFDLLNSTWEEEFKEDFSKNLEERVGGIELSNYEDWKMIRDRILEKGFDISFEDGKLIFSTHMDLEREDSGGGMGVVYDFKTVAEEDFSELIIFENLENVREECSLANFEKCMKEKLENFDVSVERRFAMLDGESKEFYFVDLKSKQEFLFDARFSKIEFSFAQRIV